MNLRAIFFVRVFETISLSKPLDLQFIGAICFPDFQGHRSLNLQNRPKGMGFRKRQFLESGQMEYCVK